MMKYPYIEYILNNFRHLQYINKHPKKSVSPNCHENIYVHFSYCLLN
jgi:hypothetical protein